MVQIRVKAASVLAILGMEIVDHVQKKIAVKVASILGVTQIAVRKTSVKTAIARISKAQEIVTKVAAHHRHPLNSATVQALVQAIMPMAHVVLSQVLGILSSVMKIAEMNRIMIVAVHSITSHAAMTGLAQTLIVSLVQMQIAARKALHHIDVMSAMTAVSDGAA